MSLEAAYRMLGLARRAGQVSMGTQAADQAVKRGKAKLIWLSEDAGSSTEEKVRRLAERSGIPFIHQGSRSELGRYCGKDEAVVLAITDVNLAAGILDKLGLQSNNE